jgi:hypothetical protein
MYVHVCLFITLCSIFIHVITAAEKEALIGERDLLLQILSESATDAIAARDTIYIYIPIYTYILDDTYHYPYI